MEAVIAGDGPVVGNAKFGERRANKKVGDCAIVRAPITLHTAVPAAIRRAGVAPVPCAVAVDVVVMVRVAMTVDAQVGGVGLIVVVIIIIDTRDWIVVLIGLQVYLCRRTNAAIRRQSHNERWSITPGRNHAERARRIGRNRAQRVLGPSASVRDAPRERRCMRARGSSRTAAAGSRVAEAGAARAHSPAGR